MMLLFFVFFFFFSSRRRHTRWTGDWSSDVCSSDLRTWSHGVAQFRGDHHLVAVGEVLERTPEDLLARPVGVHVRGVEEVDALLERSEERRVGKECRSRWSAYH